MLNSVFFLLFRNISCVIPIHIFFYIVMRLANTKCLGYLLGLVLPVVTTVVCLLVGGVPKSQQKMMISLEKSQLIVSNVLLAFLVFSVFYLLIVFARINTKQGLLSLLANKVRHKGGNRQRYYSLATDMPQSTDDQDNSEATTSAKTLAAESSNNELTRIDLGLNDESEEVDDAESRRFVHSSHANEDEEEDEDAEEDKLEAQNKIYNGLCALACLF